MKIRVLVFHEISLVAAFEHGLPGMPIEDEAIALAEKAFELTNTIDKPWWENPWAISNAKKGCRSTSVGDLITIRSNREMSIYRVAPNGFENVTP
jgi:hypothetical protein